MPMTSHRPASNRPGGSRAGAASPVVILVVAVAFLALAAAAVYYNTTASDRPPAAGPAALPPEAREDLVARAAPAPTTAEEAGLARTRDWWERVGEILPQVLKVERVDESGDEKRQARIRLRGQFQYITRQIEALMEEGLAGEALYRTVEQNLLEMGAQEALPLLDGLRKVQESLAQQNLEAMSPRERFEALRQARVDAFGAEAADMLFFTEETWEEYKLVEQQILGDAGLSEAEKQRALRERRSALQVALAARGAYVSFGDERQEAVEKKLRKRYGAALDDMTAEERRAATWELHRRELPPDVMQKLERWAAEQERRQEEAAARLKEREALLNDVDMVFQ